MREITCNLKGTIMGHQCHSRERILGPGSELGVDFNTICKLIAAAHKSSPSNFTSNLVLLCFYMVLNQSSGSVSPSPLGVPPEFQKPFPTFHTREWAQYVTYAACSILPGEPAWTNVAHRSSPAGAQYVTLHSKIG